MEPVLYCVLVTITNQKSASYLNFRFWGEWVLEQDFTRNYILFEKFTNKLRCGHILMLPEHQISPLTTFWQTYQRCSCQTFSERDVELRASLSPYSRRTWQRNNWHVLPCSETPQHRHNSKKLLLQALNKRQRKRSMTSHFSRLVIWPQNDPFLLISYNTRHPSLFWKKPIQIYYVSGNLLHFLKLMAGQRMASWRN